MLIENFIWLNRSLQLNCIAQGLERLSRPESQLMLLVSVGFSRPIEIIRSLGISRQALNVTIKSLKQRGLIKTKTDPNDKRCKIILFADSGKHSRDNDFEVLMALVRELETRLGTKTMDGLYRGLEVEWG